VTLLLPSAGIAGVTVTSGPGLSLGSSFHVLLPLLPGDRGLLSQHWLGPQGPAVSP
jgi:hypothetical protein